MAHCGGAAKSSRPPTRSVSTFEFRTRLYSFSSGFAGHASRMRPPAQIRSVPGAPITDPRSAWAAKKRLPAAASVRAPIAATSPQTCPRGKMSCAIADRSQAPLPSALSAARSVSIVNGPSSGPPPPAVAFIRPKKAAALTLPFLIGRNQKRPGMSSYAEWTDAVRPGFGLSAA